jgi:hypothetical protein
VSVPSLRLPSAARLGGWALIAAALGVGYLF